MIDLGISFSGEATLHQKLGEQDSWLKPKLLAAKLELSRRTPIQLSRSPTSSSASTRGYDFVQRQTTLMLSLAFFVGTSSCVLSEYLDLDVQPLAKMPLYDLFSSCGYSEVVTSLLLVVLAVYGVNPWSVINHGCHQACVFTWVLLFFYAAIEGKLLAKLPALYEIQFCFRGIASAVVFFVSSRACKRRSEEEVRHDRAKKPGKFFPSVTFSHKMLPIEEQDETLTQDLLSTTASTVASRMTTPTTQRPKGSTPGLIKPPIIAPQFGPLLYNHEFHRDEEKSSISFCAERESNPPACDISELHIDQAEVASISANSAGKSPPFEVRRYNPANTSGIDFGFGPSSSHNLTNRPVLKPPRFVYEQPRQVAQSSWVAGGYWHQNRGLISQQEQQQTLPSFPNDLSRSSSQTSGFFSTTNEPLAANLSGGLRNRPDLFASLPNSRVNSVCGDRHSVLSEPVYNSGQADFSLRSLGNQLAFFDTSRAASKVRRFSGGDDSSDSSVGRLSQEALSVFKPRAESSPIERRENSKSESNIQSILQKKIEISFSLSSLLVATVVPLLIFSLGLNAAYFMGIL